MKKFFKSSINLIINIFIFCFIVLIFFILLFFVFTKIANVEMDNPISYLKSLFDNETSNVSTIPNYVNTHIQSYPQHNISINMGSNNLTQNLSSVNSSNGKYYYHQLDNYEKIIYDTLENNINNLKKQNYKINLSENFNDLLKSKGQNSLNTIFQTALDAFFYDHPELFYIDLTKISLMITSKSIGPITTYKVTIEPKNGKNYLDDNFNSEQLANAAIAKVEIIKNNILDNITGYNDYDKILAVHDMLVNSVEYSASNLPNNNTHNIYGTLIEKKVVCEGYAKTFKYILDSLGIECILVSGTATNSSNETESHMWNYVKLDNNWYGVDVTWDDPIIIGGSFTNHIRDDYFCKGNSTFSQSHTVNNKISDIGKAFSLPTLSNKNYK